MKNILFISPTGTLDNGAEISIVNFMEYLVKKNYKIYNIAPQHHHPKQIEYYDYCESIGVRTHFIPVLKWWWEDAPGGIPSSSVQRMTAYLKNINEIRDVITKKNIDIVITNTVNVFQGAVAAACENVSHFWLIHEFPENEFAYYKPKIHFIESNSDEIFAVQGGLKKVLDSSFTMKINSFYPYSKISDRELIIGQKNRIVCVGMISERKNQLELIKAYELLSVANLELVFIGSKEKKYYDLCREYIKKNNIIGITFLGYQSDPWQEVTDKDICVFPSKNETFGLVYVEAVLKGIPTIISDNLGHRTAFDILKVGKMYKTGDVLELSGLIERYLENFKIEKSLLMENSTSLKSMYSIEKAYKNITDKLEISQGPKVKDLFFIKDLIGVKVENQKSAKGMVKLKRILTRVKNLVVK